jgi:NTP pyrophosphatase (non-canonical NTP hydrolase)
MPAGRESITISELLGRPDPDLVNTFLAEVKEITLADLAKNHDVNLLFKNLVEEVGEFAKALTVEQGLKRKEIDESSMHEAVDVVICALALFYARGGTDEELARYGLKKLVKWKERVADETIRRNDV